MSTRIRIFGKLVVVLGTLAVAAACSSSVLDPQTERPDEGPECTFINGHFVCKPH